ncbi:uncharacterized protein [Argopecten irradians]|uniref:uncharacterized protein isoform X3 n=1 Tax=Argopecten irradians TaxID=31199 RepID=UPI003714438D
MFPINGQQTISFCGQQQNFPINGQQTISFCGQQQNFPTNVQQTISFSGQQQNFPTISQQNFSFCGQQQNFTTNGQQNFSFCGQQQNFPTNVQQTISFSGQQQNFTTNGQQNFSFCGQQQNFPTNVQQTISFSGQQQNFPTISQQNFSFSGQQQNFPTNGRQNFSFCGQQQNFPTNDQQTFSFSGQQQNTNYQHQQSIEFINPQGLGRPPPPAICYGIAPLVQQYTTCSYQPLRPQQNIDIFLKHNNVYGSPSPPPGFVAQQNSRYSNQLQEPLNRVKLIDHPPRYQNGPPPPPPFAAPQPVSLPPITSVLPKNTGCNDTHRQQQDDVSNVVKLPSIWTSNDDYYSDNDYHEQNHSDDGFSSNDDHDEDYYGHSSRLQTPRRHLIRSVGEINDEEDYNRPESRDIIPWLRIARNPISNDYHEQNHSDYELTSDYDHDKQYYFRQDTPQPYTPPQRGRKTNNRAESRQTIPGLRVDRDPISNNQLETQQPMLSKRRVKNPVSNMHSDAKQTHSPQQKVQSLIINPVRDLPPLTSKVHDSIFRKKLLRINHIGIWRFGENDFFTSVSKTWNVAQCIKHVKDSLRLRCDVDLWVKNQCTFLEKGKSISNYGGLTKLFVVQRPKKRDPGARYKSQEPDVTDPFWEGDCVSMSCGHAVVPENLFNYYWNAIKSGNIEVKCPYVPDGNSKCCEGIWEFKEVSVLACLSADERLLFLSVLFTNWLEKNKSAYLCPQCDEAIIATCQNYFMCYFCGQRGDNNTFCRRCLQLVNPPWMMCKNSECQKSLNQTKSLLTTCQERIIVNVRGCPVVRACPKCQCIIEFDDSDLCKHMTCPNRTCRTRFCFICLSIQNNTGHWPCGSAFAPCTPAPRQKVNIHLPH